eukprot:TRINITY_DN16538_c0_g1_i1.p1 TRINITY_DN16538_c0_g1~~TRINITY_DN16538_c0_g1_i1.p1  ORF type:complete len:178 (-),score=17.21 TRINITY_DN16538_c0_g1_i1:5-538(-)
MIRRPPRSTHCISSAASDVYKRQLQPHERKDPFDLPDISGTDVRDDDIDPPVRFRGPGIMGDDGFRCRPEPFRVASAVAGCWHRYDIDTGRTALGRVVPDEPVEILAHGLGKAGGQDADHGRGIDPAHVVERFFQVRLAAMDGLFLVEGRGRDIHRLVVVFNVCQPHVGTASPCTLR